MTDYPAPQQAYNVAGKPFQVFNFLSVWAINRVSAALVPFYFSDRKQNETVAVENPADGTDSSRDFLGKTTIIRSPEGIKRTQGLTVDLHEFHLNFNNATVRNMIEGHYMARAYMEWHQAQPDVRSGGKLLARPVCELFGFVDDVKELRSARNSKTGKLEPVFVVSVVGRHAEFEDANNALRSHEEGQKRSGDDIYQYVESVGDWPIGWGKKIHKHSDHGNKGGKGDHQGGKGNNNGGGTVAVSTGGHSR